MSILKNMVRTYSEVRRGTNGLIIITILHIIIITTSILNLGFKTIAPKILAHTNA